MAWARWSGFVDFFNDGVRIWYSGTLFVKRTDGNGIEDDGKLDLLLYSF